MRENFFNDFNFLLDIQENGGVENCKIQLSKHVRMSNFAMNKKKLYYKDDVSCELSHGFATPQKKKRKHSHATSL